MTFTSASYTPVSNKTHTYAQPCLIFLMYMYNCSYVEFSYATQNIDVFLIIFYIVSFFFYIYVEIWATAPSFEFSGQMRTRQSSAWDNEKFLTTLNPSNHHVNFFSFSTIGNFQMQAPAYLYLIVNIYNNQ